MTFKHQNLQERNIMKLKKKHVFTRSLKIFNLQGDIEKYILHGEMQKKDFFILFKEF